MKKESHRDYFIIWMKKKSHKQATTPFYTLEKAEQLFQKYDEWGYGLKLMKYNPKPFERHETIKVNERWEVIMKIQKRKALQEQEKKLLDKLEQVRKELEVLIGTS